MSDEQMGTECERMLQRGFSLAQILAVVAVVAPTSQAAEPVSDEKRSDATIPAPRH